MLNTDCLIHLFKFLFFRELLVFRQEPNLTELVDDELVKRNLHFNCSVDSETILSTHLDALASVCVNAVVDFRPIQNVVRHLGLVKFLRNRNRVKHLELLDAHHALNNQYIKFNLKTVRSLRIASSVRYSGVDFVPDILQACKFNVLEDLRLEEVLSSGEELLSIPGQLLTLVIIGAASFDWSNLSMYLFHYPAIRELRVSARTNRDVNLKFLATHLQHVTVLDLCNCGKFLNYEHLALLRQVTELGIDSDNSSFERFFAALSPENQLEVFRWRAGQFIFEQHDVESLQQLPKLRCIEIVATHVLSELTRFISGFGVIKGLRKFTLTISSWSSRSIGDWYDLPTEEQLEEALHNIEQLALDVLQPYRLQCLLRLPRLRMLTLRVHQPLGAQLADFFLALGNAKQLTHLRLVTGGKQILPPINIVEGGITACPKLKSVVLEMSEPELAHYRQCKMPIEYKEILLNESDA